jgi:histidinol-phosphatase (PHP family)
MKRCSVLPPDNHVHSEWSWDTHSASMRESCARAVELGLPAVAFTEHVDFRRWGPADGRPGVEVSSWYRSSLEPLDVAGYTASVEECRDRFPQLRVVSGLEAGEPHLFPGSLDDVLRRGSFERVLGSLHAVVEDGLLVGADSLWRVDPDDLMRRYLAELVTLVETSSAFEVLAHADFPRRNWPRERPFEEKAFEEEYRAVFAALAADDRVLELNTRSPLWSSTLVGWWRDEGGRALSFGSDAHAPHRVGARFVTAVDVAEAAGFGPGRDAYDYWRA